MFLANMRVSILRGTTTDTFGDPVDSNEVARTGVPASIREIRSDVITISEGRPQQVRFLVGRLPPNVEVRPGDRLQDESTGHRYIIDAVDLEARSAIMDSGARLDLRRVT